jgi:hypothetical protein
MKAAHKGLILGVTLAVSSLAPSAHATNYSLWIHGRDTATGSGCTGGTPSGWSYWDGLPQESSGVNAIAVNYDGRNYVSVTNPTVVSALNTYCTGSNSCYVACHSTGCLQIGYAYDHAYSSSNPWHINWVMAAGSAAGGSELADDGYWAVSDCITTDLKTSNARSSYNHDKVGDLIAGYVYTSSGGDWAAATTAFFPGGGAGGSGGNDSAVAFHSSAHYRSIGTYGTANATGAAGGTYWDYTQTWFVDSIQGSYGHCITSSYPCQMGNTGGISSQISAAMATYAL